MIGSEKYELISEEYRQTQIKCSFRLSFLADQRQMQLKSAWWYPVQSAGKAGIW